MDITAQITVSIKPELSESLLNVNSFKLGSTLKLKILELRGDRALIDFGKFQATADIKVPVTRGEELRVKVLESGRQLKMSVIGPEPKIPLGTDSPPGSLEDPTGHSFKKAQTDLKLVLNQALESQTGKSLPQSISYILNWLKSNYESFDLEKVVTKLIPQLKAYLENSGIFLEKYLELQKLLHGFFNQILLKVIVSEKKVADFDHEDRQVSGDSRVDLRI